MSGYTHLSTGGFTGEVRILDVGAQCGLGFYRFFVTLEFQARAAATAKIQFVSGLLSVGPALKPVQHVGYLSVKHPWRDTLDMTAAGDRKNLQLEIEFDGTRLEAIEALRGGGPLAVDVSMVLDISGTQQQPGSTEIRCSTTVVESVWIGLLNTIEYGRRMLIEVPGFDSSADPRLADVGGWLARAQDAFAQGKWRETVGQCRDMLEALALVAGDQEPKANESQKDWTKEQRLANVRRALRVLTHPARHVDEVTVRIEWGRDDAVAMLAFCAALLRVFPCA